MPHNKGKTVRKADRAARNLSQLETELRHLQQGIEVTHMSGNDHRGRLSPTAHVKKQIDKPKGQAGRSELKGGYSLQQAMGLAGNDRKYNALRMMARKYTNRYLDTSRTLKQQDKLTVTFLLAYYTKKQHPNLDDSETSMRRGAHGLQKKSAQIIGPAARAKSAYHDDGESELSEPPESIHASTQVPRPKSSRSRPTRRGRIQSGIYVTSHTFHNIFVKLYYAL
ncbi:hypothetical protein P692DRAFT_201810897 [Suillus brevipes Sb2]|nr:hypothetical protein P692DRAFT_201810897 [Suillus brevipes Sb2]